MQTEKYYGLLEKIMVKIGKMVYKRRLTQFLDSMSRFLKTNLIYRGMFNRILLEEVYLVKVWCSRKIMFLHISI